MAVQYIGEIALHKLLHQPESRFGIARDGTVRATEVYVCRTDDMVKFAYQLYRAAHPTIPYIGVDDVDAQEEEGGQSRIVIKYAGYDGTGAGAGGGFTETFSERRSVRAEPIETNENLVGISFADRADVEAVLTKIKTSTTPVAQPLWFHFSGGKPTDAKSALLYYKMRAQESYYEPGTEFVRRTVFNSKSVFRLNAAVGKIDVPPSRAPKYPGRNWLFKGRDQEEEGFSTRIDEVWELSGPLKWDEFFYKKPAP